MRRAAYMFAMAKMVDPPPTLESGVGEWLAQPATREYLARAFAEYVGRAYEQERGGLAPMAELIGASHQEMLTGYIESAWSSFGNGILAVAYLSIQALRMHPEEVKFFPWIEGVDDCERPEDGVIEIDLSTPEHEDSCAD